MCDSTTTSTSANVSLSRIHAHGHARTLSPNIPSHPYTRATAGTEYLQRRCRYLSHHQEERKRADAHQLQVLNETYNRTAFPSTEERAELAKKLDMSAAVCRYGTPITPFSTLLSCRVAECSTLDRFQNKRQSMRQGGRQSSSTGPLRPSQTPALHARPPASGNTYDPNLPPQPTRLRRPAPLTRVSSPPGAIRTGQSLPHLLSES